MTNSYPGAPSPGGAPLGDTSSSEAIVSQARSVKDAFHFGDDRVITNPPNWAAQSSTQLYNGAVNNNDPGFADAMGQTWTGHGKDLHDAADTLYEAITQLGGAWVGEAAGAAQGALIGVANASSTAGDAARAMGKRMSEQAAAAAEVKKMPPPKEFNFDKEIGRMLAGHPAAMSSADIKAEWDSANAVQAEQQAYMDAYTNSMSQVDGTTPSFGPESIGMKPMSGVNYGGGDGAGFRGSVGVDGGPSLSGAQGGINAAAPGMNAGAPGQAGPLAGQPGTAAPVSNLAHGPLSTSGTAAVSAASSGLGSAGAIGAAAIGAGAGIAGVRAVVKGGGRSGGKKPGEQPAEGVQPAAQAPDQAPDQPVAAAPAGEQAQVPPQQPGWQPPEVHGAPGTAPQQAASTAPASWQPPGVGTGAVTGQPGAVADPASWQPPPVGDPSATAPQPAPQELGSGNVTSAGEAPASDAVTASTDQGSAAAQSLGQGQQAGQLAQGNAAAMQAAPPMGAMGGGAPMGGGGAGMAGAADIEHEQASYLIEPDPDELFGVGEAITSGVIGADDEDD